MKMSVADQLKRFKKGGEKTRFQRKVTIFPLSPEDEDLRRFGWCK